MLYKIKNINVINSNLFTCPYTAGFSLASIKGLVDFLNIKLVNLYNFPVLFDKFGIIVNANNAKIKEIIQRDSSTSPSTNKSYKSPSILQHRYFDFTIDLVLSINENDFPADFNISNINEQLAFASNLAKVQGGIIKDEVKAEDIISFYSINSHDLTKDSYPLGYLITEASDEINKEADILEQLSDKLAQLNTQYMLMSNGYKYIEPSEYKRVIDLQEEVESFFVEPNLTLTKAVPTYLFNKDPTILKNFLFSTVKNKDYFIVSARNNYN